MKIYNNDWEETILKQKNGISKALVQHCGNSFKTYLKFGWQSDMAYWQIAIRHLADRH